MAINGYFGLPRSGKSYSVVEYVIIPALKNGRHVITNIPLQDELLIQVFGGTITQLHLDALDDPDLADKLPAGSVCVLDEAWRRWPSGQKVSHCNKKDLRLLKEHGHRVDASGKAMQIVLVTQVSSDLASWVRNLINHSFHMTKLDAVGADSRFSVKVYKGCPTGDRIPAKYLVRDAYGTYRPEIYQYYQSATQSESETLNVGDEKAIDKRGSVFGPAMVALVIFIGLAIGGGAYLLSYYMGMSDRAKERQEAITGSSASSAGRLQAPELAPVQQVMAQADSVAAVAPSAVPTVPLSTGPLLSQQWRVVGYVERGESGGSETAWQSLTWYGYFPAVGSKEKWLDDLVVLQGLGVVRSVPASECTKYPNSRDYYCDVDGERVTPWSGQMGFSAEVVGKGSVDGVKEAAPKAVEKTI